MPGIKQALAFISLSLNSSPFSPGFVTKFLHVWEPRKHVGECNRLPSSAGLLAKEHNPDDGYGGETSPPLHLGFLVFKWPLGHDLFKYKFNGLSIRGKDLLPSSPAMTRAIHHGGFLFVSMARRALA